MIEVTMIRLLLCLIFVGWSACFLWGVNIDRVEYFLDTDPGLGMGTPLSFSPGEDISTSLTLDFTNYSTGMHNLVIRARDTNGKWSIKKNKLLLKQTEDSNPITYMEYFLDADPGFGNGIALAFTGVSEVICSDTIPFSNLSAGLHFLYVRCRNEQGFWSNSHAKLLLKGAQGFTPLIFAEVFFDSDPGLGNGFPLSVESDEPNLYSIDFNLSEPITTPGLHLMLIRTRSSAGQWSINAQKHIYLSPLSAGELCSIDWYFTGSGADPLQTFSFPLASPIADVTQALEASIAHLQQDGQYRLHICATNTRGQISMMQVFPFTVDFSPNNLNISFAGQNITLTWDEIIGADHYLVNHKTDPLQEPGSTIITDTNSLLMPLGSKGFFSVKAQMDE